jgi:hypothetical protein
MLWDRKIGSLACFGQHQMASDLSHDVPAYFGKRFGSFLAENVSKLANRRTIL